MTKYFSKKHLYWFTFGLFIFFIFSPVCVKFLTDTWGETWLTFTRPLLICTTIISTCFLVKHKSIALAILSIFMITTICEWVMIRNYSIYMDIDHFICDHKPRRKYNLCKQQFAGFVVYCSNATLIYFYINWIYIFGCSEFQHSSENFFGVYRNYIVRCYSIRKN